MEIHNIPFLSLEPLVIINHSRSETWSHPNIQEYLNDMESDECEVYTGNLIMASFTKDGETRFTAISHLNNQDYALLLDAYMWKFQPNPDKVRNRKLFDALELALQTVLGEDVWVPGGRPGEQFYFTDFGLEINRDGFVYGVDFIEHSPDVGIHKEGEEWCYST